MQRLTGLNEEKLQNAFGAHGMMKIGDFVNDLLAAQALVSKEESQIAFLALYQQLPKEQVEKMIRFTVPSLSKDDVILIRNLIFDFERMARMEERQAIKQGNNQ